MLRDRNGNILSDDLEYLFEEELKVLFNDEAFRVKYGFKEHSYHSICNFLFLFHNHTKQLQYNEIWKIYNNKILRKLYYKNLNDRLYQSMTTYQKTVATTIKKRYLRVQTGAIDHKKYTKKLILQTLFNRYAKAKDIAFNNTIGYKKANDNFAKKFDETARRYMQSLTRKYFKFKNTKPAIRFEATCSYKPYKDKIDIEPLFRYLSVTEVLDSSEENFQWLLGLITIILRLNNDKIDNQYEEEVEKIDDDFDELVEYFLRESNVI